MLTPFFLAAATLPAATECETLTTNPASALAFSAGPQGFICGYPIVDMLKQKHNETHRVSGDQPVLAPVNRIVTRIYLPKPEALDGRYVLAPVERISN